MKNKGLIIIPYAYGGNTGVSIQNVDKQFEIYLKNVCVSAISAKKNAGSSSEVCVVCNVSIPQQYKSLLVENNVKIEICDFDRFNFGSHLRNGKRVRWQLAYYKLCALAHCVEKFDYEWICYLDSDVYVQNDFLRIWKEATYNIMLLDVNEPSNGYMVKEMQKFLNKDIPLTHYGGEFFAASKDLAKVYIQECTEVFNEMVSSNFVSENGDEFISSIAASRLKDKVKNAGAYIRRYWTGSYRLVCTDYDKSNITILHVPAEKEQGMIVIFSKYISNGKIPSNSKLWSKLHLRRQSLRVAVGQILRKINILK